MVERIETHLKQVGAGATKYLNEMREERLRGRVFSPPYQHVVNAAQQDLASLTNSLFRIEEPGYLNKYYLFNGFCGLISKIPLPLEVEFQAAVDQKTSVLIGKTIDQGGRPRRTVIYVEADKEKIICKTYPVPAPLDDPSVPIQVNAGILPNDKVKNPTILLTLDATVDLSLTGILYPSYSGHILLGKNDFQMISTLSESEPLLIDGKLYATRVVIKSEEDEPRFVREVIDQTGQTVVELSPPYNISPELIAQSSVLYMKPAPDTEETDIQRVYLRHTTSGLRLTELRPDHKTLAWKDLPEMSESPVSHDLAQRLELKPQTEFFQQAVGESKFNLLVCEREIMSAGDNENRIPIVRKRNFTIITFEPLTKEGAIVFVDGVMFFLWDKIQEQIEFETAEIPNLQLVERNIARLLDYVKSNLERYGIRVKRVSSPTGDRDFGYQPSDYFLEATINNHPVKIKISVQRFNSDNSITGTFSVSGED